MKSWTSDPRKLSVIALVLAVVFFIALNVFFSASVKTAQLDLTANHTYTLSEGTRKVLASVREPVTLRLFVSRSLVDASPGLSTYSARVQELLERYATLSHGKIKFEIINPEPFSPEEDRAVGFQLQGIPVSDAGELGYFGLAGTNTTDDQDTIGFISPQREPFLEYDLTRLVYNLANPKKKVVGLISGLPVDADPLKKYKPWQIIEQLKQFFEVRSFGLSPEIKDDIDLLMIVHPIGLDDKALYAIDQYVLRGGKAIVFVDPFAEEGSRSNQAMRMPPDSGSDLDKLFKTWGIDYQRDKVLGDRGTAQRVQADVDPMGRPVITDYVAWMTLKKPNIKAKDVVTGDLQQVTVASAGGIAKAKDAKISFDPLLWSTKAAALIDASKVRFQPNPAAILRDFKPENKTFVIAARVSGALKSAFPDGPPKPKKDDTAKTQSDGKKPKDAETTKTHLKESKTPANLIVVADTDILADRFWLRIQDLFGQTLAVPTANNADFVINAVDNLSGSKDLIGLRSRGFSSRPFDKVEEIQRNAEREYRSREQALEKKLQDIEKKLQNLQTKEKAGGKLVLSPKQQEAIRNFRADMVNTRKELRQVQLALRKDIDRLDSWVTVINIGAMPIFVGVLAIALALVRRGRAARGGAD